MVTRSEVIDAYRLLLGREPESETAIAAKLPLPDWVALRQDFMGSPEYDGHAAGHDRPANALLASANRVEVEVERSCFDALVGHVRRTWEALGQERPHWSVLTNAAFLPEQIGHNLDSFYASGAIDLTALAAALDRAEMPMNAQGRVFELGCGVGRLTEHLAGRFRAVVACDVSRPHLDIARDRLRSRGIGNVAFRQLTNLSVLGDEPPFDLFFSLITLQHNPPPLIYAILKTAFARLSDGGVAYFQVPVHQQGYSFRIGEYLQRLETGAAVMEMHLVPQHHLFALFATCGMTVRDLLFDDRTGGDYLSASILLQKTGRARQSLALPQ